MISANLQYGMIMHAVYLNKATTLSLWIYSWLIRSYNSTVFGLLYGLMGVIFSK